MKRLWLCGLTVAAVGCDNRPTIDRRGNLTLCGSRFAGENCEGDLTVTGDINIGGTINAPAGGAIGGVVFDGDGSVAAPGGVTAGTGNETVIIPPPPDKPPTDGSGGGNPPAALSANLLEPVNGTKLTRGQNFNIVFSIAGGEPPYAVKCLVPGMGLVEKTFAVGDLRPDGERWLAVMTGRIDDPTSEAMFCTVSDSAGERFPAAATLSAWLFIE